jgi:hypothetical protein
MRQVSKHASDETCWIVVNGKVCVLLLLLVLLLQLLEACLVCHCMCEGVCVAHAVLAAGWGCSRWPW